MVNAQQNIRETQEYPSLTDDACGTVTLESYPGQVADAGEIECKMVAVGLLRVFPPPPSECDPDIFESLTLTIFPPPVSAPVLVPAYASAPVLVPAYPYPLIMPLTMPHTQDRLGPAPGKAAIVDLGLDSAVAETRADYLNELNEDRVGLLAGGARDEEQGSSTDEPAGWPKVGLDGIISRIGMGKFQMQLMVGVLMQTF
ncbi:hypothetical protein BC937DRAFT_88655 [Endogone sp. FLAS-F59071]|nr:hypothetical protein BC937DRAFT_88655 [Endogone sp. FLAS-F59071]|eukprot:RUS18528.1 hypothetical protein BC937DRAFT_88655 [Endogone sp. FLAS-F59071]